MFDLVDPQGYWVPCCAMQPHCDHSALQDGKNIIIYYALGRGSKGSLAGMLYLLKDAFILPLRDEPRSSLMRRVKKEQVEIVDA